MRNNLLNCFLAWTLKKKAEKKIFLLLVLLCARTSLVTPFQIIYYIVFHPDTSIHSIHFIHLRHNCAFVSIEKNNFSFVTFCCRCVLCISNANINNIDQTSLHQCALRIVQSKRQTLPPKRRITRKGELNKKNIIRTKYDDYIQMCNFMLIAVVWITTTPSSFYALYTYSSEIKQNGCAIEKIEKRGAKNSIWI